MKQIENCTKTNYLGHTRYDFKIGENICVIVEPNNPVADQRWVWKAEFFEAFPVFDQTMLDKGWWIAHISVGNTFGCPSAMERFDVFYQAMTGKYNFHKKPILEGLSRGGLYVYNWAVKNTDKVGLIYGDNPVCDFKSWPAGKGTGPGSEADWQELLKCYNFESEKTALQWPGNPIDNIEPIINAEIPIVHIYGDADEVVPWDENTGEMAKRVTAFGKTIKLFMKLGAKHHPHGPDDPDTFTEWVISNSIK